MALFGFGKPECLTNAELTNRIRNKLYQRHNGVDQIADLTQTI